MYLELKSDDVTSHINLVFTFKASQDEFREISKYLKQMRENELQIESDAADKFSKKFIDLIERFEDKLVGIRIPISSDNP